MKKFYYFLSGVCLVVLTVLVIACNKQDAQPICENVDIENVGVMHNKYANDMLAAFRHVRAKSGIIKGNTVNILESRKSISQVNKVVISDANRTSNVKIDVDKAIVEDITLQTKFMTAFAIKGNNLTLMDLINVTNDYDRMSSLSKSYIEDLNTIFYNEKLSLDEFCNEVAKLETSYSSLVNAQELEMISMISSVSQSSAQYWETNAELWGREFNPDGTTEECKGWFSGRRTLMADAIGVLGGGVRVGVTAGAAWMGVAGVSAMTGGAALVAMLSISASASVTFAAWQAWNYYNPGISRYDPLLDPNLKLDKNNIVGLADKVFIQDATLGLVSMKNMNDNLILDYERSIKKQ